jgi:hypothetical protein
MISRCTLFGGVVMETRHVGTRAASGQSRVPRFDAAGASDQDESVTTTYHLLSALPRNLLVTAVTRETPEDRHLPNKFDHQPGPNTRPRKATCLLPPVPTAVTLCHDALQCVYCRINLYGIKTHRLRRRSPSPGIPHPADPNHDTARGPTGRARSRPGHTAASPAGAPPRPTLG